MKNICFSFLIILFFSVFAAVRGGQAVKLSEHVLSSEKKIVSIEGFKEPIGIAIDKDGFIYISDAGNNRIVKFERR